MTNVQQLIDTGCDRISWAERSMPVLRGLRQEWSSDKPLTGLRVGACLHVTTETANLMMTLADAGAEVRLCASNPLSTQDYVSAALTERFSIPTPSRRGESTTEYYKNINFVLDLKPHIVMDDGADLMNTLHQSPDELLEHVIAATEETTTGVVRLRAMAKDRALRIPVIAVNEATTKHMFDNRYGTGQSSIDGVLRATNVMIAGMTVVIVGYGWCGRGLAARAKGMGGRVCVVEADPRRALEAAMDGFWVGDMMEAAEIGDLFITATGNTDVIDKEHFQVMKDGTLLANAGHFNVEINLDGLSEMAVNERQVRSEVCEYELSSGRRLCVLGQGRLVNLACAEGHPAHVMDMSFANQALVCHWLVTEKPELKNEVYSVPKNIDELVARRKLDSMEIKVQELTAKQRRYLESWDEGT